MYVIQGEVGAPDSNAREIQFPADRCFWEQGLHGEFLYPFLDTGFDTIAAPTGATITNSERVLMGDASNLIIVGDLLASTGGTSPSNQQEVIGVSTFGIVDVEVYTYSDTTFDVSDATETDIGQFEISGDATTGTNAIRNGDVLSRSGTSADRLITVSTISYNSTDDTTTVTVDASSRANVEFWLSGDSIFIQSDSTTTVQQVDNAGTDFTLLTFNSDPGFTTGDSLFRRTEVPNPNAGYYIFNAYYVAPGKVFDNASTPVETQFNIHGETAVAGQILIANARLGYISKTGRFVAMTAPE